MQEVALLCALEIPIAASWKDLGDLPAMLVQRYTLYRAAESEAREWKRLDAELAAGKKK